MHHKFWTNLQDKLVHWTQRFPNFVGGFDANAHMSYETEPHIGTHGLEARTNTAGTCLQSLLRHIGGWLPSTYECCHSGDTSTWVSNVNGQGARCDYILLPCAWQGQCRTAPDDTLDAGTNGIDHMPLQCKIEICLPRGKKMKPTGGFDRRALQRCSHTRLADFFQDYPKIPWSMDVHQHATELAQWIGKQLRLHFPPAKNKPRKSYISDQTWQIRQTRTSMRRLMAHHCRHASSMTRSVVLQAWRTGEMLPTKDLLLMAMTHVKLIVQIRRRVAQLTKDLQKALRHDRTMSLEQLGEQAKHMTQADFAAALKALGVQSKKKPSYALPLPMVRDMDGTPLDTLGAIAERWRSHFSQQEDGQPTTIEELMHLCDAKAATGFVCPDWFQLPTFQEVEASFRRTKTNKAYFADDIPGDLLSRIPHVLTNCFFPLLLKQAAYQKEALLHKGGRLVPAYKKGDSTDCNSYRSLFISSPLGKALHSIYRQELGQIFDGQRLQMQLGGLKGHSIVQASHALRLYHTNALKTGKSCAFLFIDIQSAFYRLLRQHLTTCTQDERGVEQLFHSLGLNDYAFEEFQALYHGKPALEASGASPFLVSLFQEFYQSTWYSVTGSEVLTLTRRGSRPGDSFADICFGFVLSRIMRKIEEQLIFDFPFMMMKWNGQSSPFPSDATQRCLGPLLPIWADDVAVAIQHDNASELLKAIPQIANHVLHALAVAGLQPNLKPGKTEILVELRGEGSLQAKRDWLEANYKFPLTSPLFDEPLRSAHCYKHLGTFVQQSAKLTKDLSVKFAIAHDTFTRFRPQIFGNRSPRLKTKVQYFRSLILSAITFSCATWEMPTKRQALQMRNGFLRLYKRLAWAHRGSTVKEWSFDQVRAYLELPQPEEVCREARLRYLMQLIRTGQPHTWALIQEQKTWYAIVCEDLEWLQAFCPENDIPTGAEHDWWKAEEWAQHHPRQWKSVIRKAMARAVSFHVRWYDWSTWHADIQNELVEIGAIAIPRPQLADVFWCLSCGKKFGSNAAMAVHAFKKHSRVQTARRFVEGQTCLCCLKKYGSYVSLVNHVKRQTSCMQFYQTKPYLLDPPPGVNSRADRTRNDRLHDPFMQAEGPHEARDGSSAITDPQIQDECTRLQTMWDAALKVPGVDEMLRQLKMATLSSYLYPIELSTCFERWSYSKEEDWTMTQLCAMRFFQQNFSFEWFLGETEGTKSLPQQSLAFFAAQAQSLQGLSSKVIRPPQYKPRVFAHLFSGHRRIGDIQSHLEQAGVFAISVDIIFHADFGDLAKPETFSFFARALAENVLLGFIGGPPCETWSRARGTILSDGQPGPRIVRSLARPMGLLGLRKREHEQVVFGSRLLGITLKLMTIALRTGKTAILEHPAEDNVNCHQVCIWRLPVVCTLLRFQQCRRIRVFQGFFGAKSPKPTDLLCVNVTEKAEQMLLSGRTTALPQTASIGKGTQGEWLTTSLKEYPSDFCRLLANIFLEKPARLWR